MGDTYTPIRKKIAKDDLMSLKFASVLAWISFAISLTMILDTILPPKLEEEKLVAIELEYIYGKGNRIIGQHYLAITDRRLFVMPAGLANLPKGTLLRLKTGMIFQEASQVQALEYDWVDLTDSFHRMWLGYALLFLVSIALMIVIRLYREQVEVVLTVGVMCLFNLLILFILIGVNQA